MTAVNDNMPAGLRLFSVYGGPLVSDVRYRRELLGEKAVLTRRHLQRFLQGCMGGMVYPVDTIDDIKHTYQEVEESDGALVLAETAHQIQDALRYRQFAVVLCANFKTLGSDLGLIGVLRRLGVRMLSLSLNRRNLLADGCGERTSGGLSYLGIDAVAELNRRRILVDVSHLSDSATADVLTRSKAPVVASHSNCRVICDNLRNLPDDLIKGIAAAGGLMCPSVYPTMVAHENPTLEGVLDHIDRMVELAGIEHVGIGTDYVDFGTDILADTLHKADPGRVLYGAVQSHIHPKGLESASDLSNLIAGLLRRGYSEAQVQMITWENFSHLLERIDS